MRDIRSDAAAEMLRVIPHRVNPGGYSEPLLVLQREIDSPSLFGATDLVLQTRTKVLNRELDEVFRGWNLQFRPATANSPTS